MLNACFSGGQEGKNQISTGLFPPLVSCMTKRKMTSTGPNSGNLVFRSHLPFKWFSLFGDCPSSPEKLIFISVEVEKSSCIKKFLLL